MTRHDSRPARDPDATKAFVPSGEPESASAFGLRTAGEILCRYLVDEIPVPPVRD